VAASQEDARPRVWDLLSGEEIGHLRGHTGTVKALQVEAHLCATGATDGAVRLWDLRRVGGEGETSDWVLSDVLEETEDDGDGTGTSTGDSVVVDRPREVVNGTRSRSRAPKDDTSGPCVRVLEGHSKAVTALYFENDTLVRLSFFQHNRSPSDEKKGDGCVRQNLTPMGSRNGAMCDDDGHPLGDITSADQRSPGTLGRISRRGYVRGADAPVRGRELGALPGLYRGRAVVGVCAREREWGRRRADVGHAHWSSSSDSSRAYRSRDLSPVR